MILQHSQSCASLTSTTSQAQTMPDKGRIDAILTINQGFEKYLESSSSQTGSLPGGIGRRLHHLGNPELSQDYLNSIDAMVMSSF